MKLSDLQIRDPFVLPLPARGEYLLYGTTDRNAWSGPGTGFDAYRSRDLQHWEGPIPAFRPPAGFWATTQFWAPEVHAYGGRYYMFATFKAPGRSRGTQVLVADDPAGPFEPLTDGPVTPDGWECLDATLWVEDGAPWMVYCHEWVQVGDGRMVAQRLSADLRHAEGEPLVLFQGSDGPWARPLPNVNLAEVPGAEGLKPGTPLYITDGPFLHRTASGALLMLWSSVGEQGYAMGLARSRTGKITGPWEHDAQPLFAAQGGHGMIFQTLAGQLMLTLHQPNKTPHERARFFVLREEGDALVLG
ncbi:MAG: glycoside hydrolase family 43 protein [Verrucomicrobiota bacterium JB022]|nr:glycoside hydrolase family 43 protein [Verrucomicrobiota bacterium JB022]